MEEIWKPCHLRPELYHVSNLGNVKSVNYNHTGKEKLLTLIINKYGYVRTCVYIPKKSNVSIHRLVAIVFIPNPENHPQVNHINGIKADNRVDNLEWVSVLEQNTHKQNMKETLSGYTGVNPLESGRFSAAININKKRVYLGSFDTPWEAHERYLQALKENNLTNKYVASK